ncbi:selection and upkeep of intraepithelial T-cells protein 7-like [Oreochromis niloticus]|uniref:selection and upkeep of intraepithelial T-cells protein 7-like n=1 Tax=Oreochromis niloticus TaxID=8128 RepID=UPI000904F1E7|nr:selection and upkeep of intraepithelial T-cells protein 7-like [Oreochromis niloticus]
MSAVTASLCSTLMFVLFVSADQKNITAESGQDVTLTCRAPNNNIISLEWSRTDLTDKYVLLYRNGQFVPDSQHPSFKNRVDLQDRQMKDGDVSLILKDVTINDTGTYECGVVQTGTEYLNPINTTYLHVVPPGQTGGQEKDGGNKDGGKEDKEKEEDGSVGLIVGLSVLVVLLVAGVVGFLIYRRCNLNPADPHEAEHLQPEFQKTIPAESGQDVTLTCRAPNSESEKMSEQLHQLDY